MLGDARCGIWVDLTRSPNETQPSSMRGAPLGQRPSAVMSVLWFFTPFHRQRRLIGPLGTFMWA